MVDSGFLNGDGRHQTHAKPQVINPAVLLSQGFKTPPPPDRPLNPTDAINIIQSHEPRIYPAPTSSPYTDSRRQNLYMGSIGYSTRFARDSMGYGQPNWETPTIYESEPLEPLFGRTEPLQPLPEQRRPVQNFGGDMAWFLGRPRSGPVERVFRSMANGQERVMAHRFYVQREIVN
ncbi:hypothetical protein FZEAL_2391 [Fusarium zealandicum]|uniref:Uncharacterized protein n=1 Tax=Fusarium zealandicum TaxID=1053134 RepID=A0A8H4URI4_9HYPO|nr:hypothetical protein FZEAL_2391 [Fusarium zealandicum]